MKRMSKRAKRLQRAQVKRPPMLNLVSLMDIFTILVFFLLVNSSNVPQPSNAGLKLPEAKVEKPIGETLVIQVSESAIVVQNITVAMLDDIKDEQELIPELVEELKHQAQRTSAPLEPSADGQPAEDFRIATLMADREIPFKLLKKIMLSAGEAEYAQLSLAVIGRGQDAY